MKNNKNSNLLNWHLFSFSFHKVWSAVLVRNGKIIHFWTVQVIKERSAVIIPMKTEAFWFLSRTMWLFELPSLAACLHPYPTSRHPLFLQGTSLHLLSQRQNQSCSHIVKDWLYGFFCLFKQFSDSLQKSECTITEDGKLWRDVCSNVSTTNVAAVCLAQIHMLTFTNNLLQGPLCYSAVHMDIWSLSAFLMINWPVAKLH